MAGLPLRTRDDRPRGPRGRPRISQIESWYARSLKRIGGHVGRMVEGFDLNLSSLPHLAALLKAYSEALRPWAERAARRMIGEVNAKDLSSWNHLGREISAELRHELHTAPLARRMRDLEKIQVDLITSLPTEAAERVAHLTRQALLSGRRADEIAEDISRTGEVTESRALMIARTEVSRTATAILQGRCQTIGVTHYIWRTANDGDVRPGHRAMEGKVCEWARPPAVNENGRMMNHHPGEIWNCRCYAEPVITED